MMETHKTELVSRYLYRSPYVVDVDAFRRAIDLRPEAGRGPAGAAREVDLLAELPLLLW